MQLYVVGTADSVLIKEVSLIQSVLYSKVVPLQLLTSWERCLDSDILAYCAKTFLSNSVRCFV